MLPKVNLSQGSIQHLVAKLGLTLTMSLCFAGPVKAAWWASEWTQIANNVELMAENMTSMDQLEQQYQLVEESKQQTDAAKTNLKGFDSSNFTDVRGAFKKGQIELELMQGEYKEMRRSYTELSTFFTKAMKIGSMKNMKPQEVFKAYRDLAAQGQKTYKVQMDRAEEAIANAKRRSKAIEQLSAKIPALEGNKDSLQLLNQSNALIATSLTEIQGQMNSTQAQAAQDRSQAEAEREMIMRMQEQAHLDAMKRAEENAKLIQDFKVYTPNTFK